MVWFGFPGLTLIFMNSCGFLCIYQDFQEFVGISMFSLWFLGDCSRFLYFDLLISWGWSWTLCLGLGFCILISWFLWVRLDFHVLVIIYMGLLWIFTYWSLDFFGLVLILEVGLNIFALVLIFINSSGFLSLIMIFMYWSSFLTIVLVFYMLNSWFLRIILDLFTLDMISIC